MNENLLPNYYKKIAVTIGVLALIALIFKFYLANLLQLQQERLDWIIKDLVLISLLVIAFSKEKKESDEVNRLRLKELKGAVGFGVFLLMYDSVQELIFWEGSYELKNGYELMIAILLFYLVFFSYRKSRLKKNV